MVADFAKDMKLSSGEIADVARRVREGDMTLILGAYENDLKARSISRTNYACVKLTRGDSRAPLRAQSPALLFEPC